MTLVSLAYTRDRVGLSTSVVDFEADNSRGKRHRHDGLINWVWRYFEGGDDDGAALGCDLTRAYGVRFPVFFQHDGHSRLLVGTSTPRMTASALGRDSGPGVNGIWRVELRWSV